VISGLDANTLGLVLIAVAVGAFAVYWHARRRPELQVLSQIAAVGIVALLVALVLVVAASVFGGVGD
jgi:hypothetical protein